MSISQSVRFKYTMLARPSVCCLPVNLLIQFPCFTVLFHARTPHSVLHIQAPNQPPFKRWKSYKQGTRLTSMLSDGLSGVFARTRPGIGACRTVSLVMCWSLLHPRGEKHAAHAEYQNQSHLTVTNLCLTVTFL